MTFTLMELVALIVGLVGISFVLGCFVAYRIFIIDCEDCDEYLDDDDDDDDDPTDIGWRHLLAGTKE